MAETSPTDGSITVQDDTLEGKQTGVESSLSTYAGPYVSDMLSTGQALADMDYEAYDDILTAPESQLQTDAFTGIAGLTVPTDEQMGVYTPQSITDEDFNLSGYMNPYKTEVVEEQIKDLKKQADIRRMENAARMTAAGSYGGSRQAVLEGAFEDALLDDISDAYRTGNVEAYNQAIAQFNLEQNKKIAAQDKKTQYGFDVINKLADLGGIERAIDQEGVEADIAQFEEEANYPYKNVQFMQSLLQNLPLETQQYTYATPSDLQNVLGSTSGLMELFNFIFGGGTKPTESAGTDAGTDAALSKDDVIDLVTNILKGDSEAETEESDTIIAT